MVGTSKSQQSASTVLASSVCSIAQPCLHPSPKACAAPLLLRDHHPAGLQGHPPASSSSPKKCTQNNYILGWRGHPLESGGGPRRSAGWCGCGQSLPHGIRDRGESNALFYLAVWVSSLSPSAKKAATVLLPLNNFVSRSTKPPGDFMRRDFRAHTWNRDWGGERTGRSAVMHPRWYSRLLAKTVMAPWSS